MPFHLPGHNQPHHARSQSHDNYYSAVNAIYRSGQTVTSVGAPTTQWVVNEGAASNNADQTAYAQYPSNGSAAIGGQHPSGHAALNHPAFPPAPVPLRSQFEIPRNAVPSSHILQPESAMSDVHHYGAPPSYGNESGMSNQLPGTLQSGLPARPNAQIGGSNTTGSVPTLPQIQTQMQQQPAQSLSARPSVSHHHSYSRSSPGNMDIPKYKPFSNKSPEGSKYISPPSSYAPPPGQGPSSYSPLGLSDIRPRADTLLSDTTFLPSIAIDPDVVQHPTSSNYVASWPIYAVDWCKWAPKGSNVAAGKIAIGSYLEDNHNYVGV